MVWWGGWASKLTGTPPPQRVSHGLGGSGTPPLEGVTLAWGVWTPPPRGCHPGLGGLRRPTGPPGADMHPARFVVVLKGVT